MNDSNEKKRDQLSYAAYYGLQEVVVRPSEIKIAIKDRVERITKAGFCRPNPRGGLSSPENGAKPYHNIKIADTFFSDCFPEEELAKLFESALSQKEKIYFQFLLCDPFSSIAATRANAVEEIEGKIKIKHAASARIYRRVNAGLRNIIYALNKAGLIQEIQSQDDYQDKIDDLENVKEQLDTLKAFEETNNKTGNGLNLEIKFIDTIQELPFYVVGPYVFKGVASPFNSAVNNHWSIYIDDISEDSDVFDFYSGLFDQLNEAPGENIISKNLAEMINRINKRLLENKTIFIGYGRKRDALEAVRTIIEKNGYKTNNFEIEKEKIRREAPGQEVIPIIVERAIKSSRAAILIFSADEIDPEPNLDEMQSKIFAPRLNVAHELGLCQAIHGYEGTAVITEEPVRNLISNSNLLPSNESGKLSILLERRDDGQINHDALELKIKEFLECL